VNADQRAVKVRAALHAWWDTDVNDADALQAAGNQLAVQLTAIGADFDWRPPCPDIIPKEDR